MDLLSKAAADMIMTLYYNGEPIITYDPNNDDPDDEKGNKWWLNSFDAQHQGVKASELTATYTIDFSGKPDLYEAFIHSKDYLRYQSKWTISEENKYLLTFTFDWEG